MPRGSLLNASLWVVYNFKDRMHLRYLFTLFALVISNHVFPQMANQPLQSLDLHCMPLSFFDGSAPRIRIGSEYSKGNSFSYSLDIGFGNENINKIRKFGTPVPPEYMIFEIRPEIKYYIHTGAKLKEYIATEFFYINLKKLMFNNYYLQNNMQEAVFYERANFQRIKSGIHFKYGTLSTHFKRLKTDFYVGLGLAYRKISYTEIINPWSTTEIPIGDDINHSFRYLGNKMIFNISFGVRIGYIFFKR